jgi:transcriptional regulator with XRE-family HTH domain
MKNNSSIKEKIFEIRRKKGISQEKMAQLLGISNNSFRKLEKGKTILINDRLWEIAKILEVSLEELMLEEDFNTGMSLAEMERLKFQEEIENLKNENILLKQHISLLIEKYGAYVKKAK